MKEISTDVFIENSYPGVTVGAARYPHGLLFIDAPLYARDSQAWRSSITKPGGSSDRLLVLLDEHLDRTIGAKGMKSTTIAHEKTALSIGGRSSSAKSVGVKTGAIWEYCDDLGTIHWLTPEITFTHSMFINWDNAPIALEHHAGPSRGATWVILPIQRVVFIGDTVVTNQPPFLAAADIKSWLETINLLRAAKFHDFLLISGRGEMITQEEAKAQAAFLKQAQSGLEKLARHDVNPQETEHLAEELIKEFNFRNVKETDMYKSRLAWGLLQQFINHFQPTNLDEK